MKVFGVVLAFVVLFIQLSVVAADDKKEPPNPAKAREPVKITDEGLAKRKREHYHAQTVRKEWQDLKTRLPHLDPVACDEQHLHLVFDVRTMITHAGDMSNLILDPDLDERLAFGYPFRRASEQRLPPIFT